MKTIRISDEVWNAIAEKGKFGETEDIVLRRVLGVNPVSGHMPGGTPQLSPDAIAAGDARPWKQRRAEVRMFQKVQGGKLVLQFETGQTREWHLPPKDDAPAIRRVRDAAIAFVNENGGTDGQRGAAMRALTSRGYHVTLKGQRHDRYL